MKAAHIHALKLAAGVYALGGIGTAAYYLHKTGGALTTLKATPGAVAKIAATWPVWLYRYTQEKAQA